MSTNYGPEYPAETERWERDKRAPKLPPADKDWLDADREEHELVAEYGRTWQDVAHTLILSAALVVALALLVWGAR